MSDEIKIQFTRDELVEKFKAFLKKGGYTKEQQWRDLGQFYDFLTTPEMFGERIL